jgi:hypothetical protein
VHAARVSDPWPPRVVLCLLACVLPCLVPFATQAGSGTRSDDVFEKIAIDAARGGGGASLIQPKPNVDWNDGELVAATDSRFKLSNKASHAGDLSSLWEGSLVFENNERERQWKDIEKGDLRMVLSHPRGDQFFANFRGSTDLQVFGSGVLIKPTKKLSVQGFLQETVQLNASGRNRTTYSRMQLDMRLTPQWLVQPAVYRIDARSRSHIGWTGCNLFSTFRTTTMRLTFEGDRSDRLELLHSHRFGHWTTRTGAQTARWMTAPRRRLWQWGLQRERIGVDVYHGTDQFAWLAQWGSVAFGQSWSPRGTQQVVGVRRVSVWMTETRLGARDIGVGFTFRGLLRRIAKREVGWDSFAPLHESALTTPHVRWPGFGSSL